MAQAGDRIAERYRLERRLGRGGSGEVWVATQALLGRRVALKLIDVASDDVRPVRARFVREAHALDKVQHANVVRVHEAFAEERRFVLVLELLDGESLGDRLERDGRLDWPTTAAIVLPVVSAVGTAHALGVVHRDIKPDNIFLVSAPDGPPLPKVLDFGIAKLGEHAIDSSLGGALTSTGVLIGTPHYMAPEQLYGEKDIDHRADIWAIGVTLYLCLSGRQPIEGENLGQILKAVSDQRVVPLGTLAPDLPAEVADLVDRMLRHDRDQRPNDLREVMAVLSRHADVAAPTFGAPVRPPTPDEPGWHDWWQDDDPAGAAPIPSSPPSADPGRRADATDDGLERSASAVRHAPRRWLYLPLTLVAISTLAWAIARLATSASPVSDPPRAASPREPDTEGEEDTVPSPMPDTAAAPTATPPVAPGPVGKGVSKPSGRPHPGATATPAPPTADPSTTAPPAGIIEKTPY
jgi:serine/threonine protein kinase